MMNIIIGPIFRAMGLGSWRSAATGCDNIQKAKNRACLRINITVHLECHGPDARRPEEQAYCVTAGPIGSNYSVPTYLPPPPPIFRSASTTESFFTRESSGPAGALSHLLPVSEGQYPSTSVRRSARCHPRVAYRILALAPGGGQKPFLILRSSRGAA